MGSGEVHLSRELVDATLRGSEDTGEAVEGGGSTGEVAGFQLWGAGGQGISQSTLADLFFSSSNVLRLHVLM